MPIALRPAAIFFAVQVVFEWLLNSTGKSWSRLLSICWARKNVQFVINSTGVKMTLGMMFGITVPIVSAKNAFADEENFSGFFL